MTLPLLSVCIPNFNHARYLPCAIRSLLSQSLLPDEIIIVDDASSDNSVQVIEKLAREHPRIKLIRNPVNQGCNRSINIALAQACGKYVFALAADDYVLPGCFEKIVAQMEQHPDAGACLTWLQGVDPDGNVLSQRDLPNYHSHETHVHIRTPTFLSPARVLRRLKRQAWFVNGGPMVFRREVLLEMGGYNVQLGYAADGFCSYFAALKYGLVYIPEKLIAFRQIRGSSGDAGSRNPETASQVHKRSLALMREDRFRTVFPEPFIRQMEKQVAYGTFRGLFVKERQEFRRSLEMLMPASSAVAKLLWGLFKTLGILQQCTLKVYCMNNYRALYRDNEGVRDNTKTRSAEGLADGAASVKTSRT